MKRSYVAPDDFKVTLERMRWAMTTFEITAKEVQRQTELWHEHEYKRAYSDWGRAWKRWFRMAEEYGKLKREYKLRLVEVITEEQRQADRKKADRELAALVAK